MKPNLEIVPLYETKLLIKKEYLKFMNINWHIHPEYELVLISSNGGMEYIGSYSKPINGTELLLLGPNIPHMWYTNTNDAASDNDYQIVIQFPQDIFNGILFTTRPFDHIGTMLQQAELGLSFPSADIAEISRKLNAMLTMDNFNRSLALLELLHLLTKSADAEVLSTYGFNEIHNNNSIKRMYDIYQYINTNFKKGISLEELAKIACMTPQALCKYFKQKTQKTLLEFVTEIRIGHACQLLIHGDYNIIQVCYESGYNNLSNFNRYFKKIVKMTPAEYKKKMRQHTVSIPKQDKPV